MHKTIKETVVKKLKSKRGETIGETLAAMIIIALAMTMLAGSIFSASKVNKQVKNYDTSFQISSPPPTSESVTNGVTVTHADESKSVTSVDVTVYTTEPNSPSGSDSAPDIHYVYYEPA